MHNHHHCTCSHDNVRYCKTCHVVHCLDCSKEWRENYGWNWTLGTTVPYYQNGTSTYRVNSDNFRVLTTSDVKALPAGTVTCEHKG